MEDRKRPSRIIRLNHWSKNPEMLAQISLFGKPAEVRISAGKDSFVSVKDGGITLSPGVGGIVNLQTLPQNVRYGGMVMDLPFPLSIIPSTPVTPFPKQIIMPPLKEILPTVRLMSQLASFIPGPV